MNNVLKTSLSGLIVMGSVWANSVWAGEALDRVNAEVATAAAQMDEVHDVLLTTQERNALKLKLIARQVTADIAGDTTPSVEQKMNTAITTYEITSESEQRMLLIEIQVISLAGNSAGVEP